MSEANDISANLAQTGEIVERLATKRQIKRAFVKGEIGISDALPALLFDHGMERGEAYRFLGF